MIGDAFSEGKIGALGAARSVYLALSEIASDRQSDTFTVATSYIAQRAGVTSKTVRRVIVTLKKLGFVKIQPRSANGLKLATQYSVIRSTMGKLDPSMSKAREARLPRREQLFEQSSKVQHVSKKKVLHRNNGSVCAKTGKRIDPETGEYEW